MSMYSLLADFVVVAHVVFVGFVVLGGFLALRWPPVAYVHVPTAVWGALIELAGWICPLTPLEQSLRRRAGEGGYSGGFVEHYIMPVLYPGSLTRGTQIALGVLVIAVNAVAYFLVLKRHRGRTR